MGKRILTAAMHHESNTFNPIITDDEDFSIAEGDEIFQHLRANDSLSGIIYTLLGMGWEVVPTVSARAVPNGVVRRGLYEDIKAGIISRAKGALREGPIDALTLSLHGSMRVEGIGEAEGDLLESLRNLFPEVPIIASLDMHTTMSRRMHQLCDAFVGYKCAPHTDCSETGAHAARITIAALTEGARPVSSWCPIPVLLSGERSETGTEPMRSLIRALRECERRPGIMAASYLMGFPWADHDMHGAAAYVVCDGDRTLADSEALRLGRMFWEHRRDFQFHTETYPPHEALDAAFRAVKEGGKLPVYVSDSGDNPTAGSSGDCTAFLESIMKDGRTGELSAPVLYSGIYDPAAVAACGGYMGRNVNLRFGAAFDGVTSRPLERWGIVKAFVSSWGDYRSDMALFSCDGVDVVLTSKHIGHIDPEMFRALGAEPEQRQIIVCKLGYLTAPHRQAAGRSIMALTEGSSAARFEMLPYRRINRPIYPLDDDTEFSGGQA